MKRVAAVVSVVVLLGAANCPKAHAQSGAAEIAQLAGPVEVLRKGHGQWSPGIVGSRLSINDEVRSLSSGFANLKLPDGSAVLLAENSRLLIVRAEFDSRTRLRDVVFHLAIGKVCASIAPPTETLLRANRARFAISTPAGVVRGHGPKMLMAFSPDRETTVAAVLRDQAPGRSDNSYYTALVTQASVALVTNSFVIHIRSAPPELPQSLSSLPSWVPTDVCGPSNPETVRNPGLFAAAINVPASVLEITETPLPQVPFGLFPEPPITPVPSSRAGSNIAPRGAVQICASPPCP